MGLIRHNPDMIGLHVQASRQLTAILIALHATRKPKSGAAAGKCARATEGGTVIPDEILDTARQFVMAGSSIKLDAAGLPCDPSQALEVQITTRLAQRLLHVLRPGDDDAVYRLADAWVSLVATQQGRDREAGWRWVAARSQAPDRLSSPPTSKR